MAIELLFPNSCIPSRSFFCGGCPESPVQSCPLPMHGDLHPPPAFPGASHPQLGEKRGQRLRDISAVEAQGSCLQRCVCPGTRHLGQSPLPWMDAVGAIYFPAVIVLGGAPCQAGGKCLGIGKHQSTLACSGSKSSLGRCPKPVSQPHPILERI